VLPILLDSFHVFAGDEIEPLVLVDWSMCVTGKFKKLVVDEVHACINISMYQIIGGLYLPLSGTYMYIAVGET
jgi:hypothetical protein